MWTQGKWKSQYNKFATATTDMTTRAAALDSKHIASMWGAKPMEAGGTPTNVFITTGQLLRCVVATATDISLSGAPTIQGVVTAASDLVLVAGQTDAAENGVYRVATGTWERISVNAEDWCLAIVRGGDYAGLWLLENTATPDVGTDDITFTRLAFFNELTTHTGVVASAAVLGHVKVDDTTIKVNGSSQLYSALSASGSAGKMATWSAANTLGYASAISISDVYGEVHITTAAKDAVYVRQDADHYGIRVIRDGAGAAAVTPTVRIEAQDSGDQTACLLIEKWGPGDAIGAVHWDHKAALALRSSGDGTNVIVPIMETAADSNGTPADGFGVRQDVLLASTTTMGRQASAQIVEWATANDSTRKAKWRLMISDTSERTAITAEASGTAVKLGFFGAAAVVKPTALTAIDNSTIDTTYGTQERDVITNTRTRLSELETKLKNLGLLS